MSAFRPLFLSLLLLWHSAQAFQPLAPTSNSIQHQRSGFKQKSHPRQPSIALLEGSSDNDAPKRRRKRVKRKEVEVAEEEQAPMPDLKPRDDGPVQMQVQDVRDLVGGGAPKATTTTTSTAMDTVSRSSGVSIPDNPLSEDSMAMLLEDAKELQANEKKSSSTTSDEEGGLSLPGNFRDILSTIVTIDFFVICGFLLWFLAGIFCSYILKDDTVQIAFNQLFQPVVQPALGVLMIGAIAGSFGNEDEQG